MPTVVNGSLFWLYESGGGEQSVQKGREIIWPSITFSSSPIALGRLSYKVQECRNCFAHNLISATFGMGCGSCIAAHRYTTQQFRPGKVLCLPPRGNTSTHIPCVKVGGDTSTQALTGSTVLRKAWCILATAYSAFLSVSVDQQILPFSSWS